MKLEFIGNYSIKDREFLTLAANEIARSLQYHTKARFDKTVNPDANITFVTHITPLLQRNTALAITKPGGDIEINVPARLNDIERRTWPELLAHELAHYFVLRATGSLKIANNIVHMLLNVNRVYFLPVKFESVKYYIAVPDLVNSFDYETLIKSPTSRGRHKIW